jgi:AraC-like DNA-binding protein/mannose-6-phosphate isomerase-like protein (cupin superfamily)
MKQPAQWNQADQSNQPGQPRQANQPEVPISMEPLGEALHSLRMSGVFYCASEFSTPFGLALPPMRQCLMFHFVTSGRCRLEVKGSAARELRPGDLALVPHGEGHKLTSARGVPAARLFDLYREPVSERYEILRHGGGGEPTTVVCGAVRFDHPTAVHLVSLLPRLIIQGAGDSPQTEWIHGTLRFMAAEARAMAPGGETVMTRLADILVIQAIRMWITNDPAARGGWLGALQDRQIGRAIALIHRDPGRDWALASLASEVAMSRSALAARFAQRVGEPVMQYLTRWRMHLAMSRLRETDVGIGELASVLGYGSEAAFSRAFKRTLGMTPGQVRRGRAEAAT